MTYDLLIKHGTVIDGTGAPGVMADVGISGGRITAMAPHLEGRAGHAIDASGRVVAPGFIDAHTHSDFTLLSAPGADSKVRQGITTEVVGNCGFSPAPVRAQTLELLKEYTGFLNPRLPWNWQRMERALHMIDAARARGLAVTAGIYPYIAGSTTMTSLFPAWTLEGGMERFLARIADPATRQRIIDEVQGGREGWSRANGSVGWDDIVVSSCQNQKEFEGKTVAQIAAAMGQDPAHAMMDFLVAEEGTASIIMFMMSEENVARGIAHPHVMIGSDSLALATGQGGKPHPRTYGTFPRVLGKYVRQERVITLEDGVRKMTSMAAAKLGLGDRGVLATGKAADITIFDATTVGDRATFEEPHQFPDGIDYVIVNGQIVVEHGVQHPVLPGQVLKK